MTVTLAVPLAAAVVATVTDLRTGLIKNWLTLPLLLSGLVWAYLRHGWAGVPEALAAGVLVFVSTFQFTTPGGGDLKLALGVGAWLGFEAWLPYFIGAGTTRFLLGMLVRLKIYGLKGFLAGVIGEVKTLHVPALGQKNFQVFQRPAEKIGGDPDAPAVPGALFVLGGAATAFFWGG